jgi:hypothetical protein
MMIPGLAVSSANFKYLIGYERMNAPSGRSCAGEKFVTGYAPCKSGLAGGVKDAMARTMSYREVPPCGQGV